MDDRQLDDLRQVLNPEALSRWPAGKLLVASSTRHGARSSQERARLLETTNEKGQTLFETFQVTLGAKDPAERILLDLHPDETATTNRAEHEAIAWALVHGPDSVFVTADKRASLTALAELGRGRVCHPFDLWLELLDADLVTGQQFDELCHATLRGDQGLKRMPARVERRFSSS